MIRGFQGRRLYRHLIGSLQYPSFIAWELLYGISYVCSNAHAYKDIGKRFSLHPRYLYHLRWNSGISFRIEKRVGMGGIDKDRSDAKSCAVCFISRSFPAIPEAKCRLLFNESVLTFRIWRWVCLIPKWNMKLLSSSYFQRGICHREFTNLWDLARLSGRISQRVEAQTMCHLLRLGCTL